MPDRYHTARQRHLGQMLDHLQGNGLLSWRFGYEVPPRQATGRAVYSVQLPGHRERKLDTRNAEEVVQCICDEQGIVWKPVPQPGGEVQLERVQAWIEAETRQRTSGRG